MDGRRGGKEANLPKIYYAYPTMMKLGSYTLPKDLKKNINHIKHLLSSADISIFSPEISNFYYFKKYRYTLHLIAKSLILLTFLSL